MKLGDILERCIISAEHFSGKTFPIERISNDPDIKKGYDEIHLFTDSSLLDDIWRQITNIKVYLDHNSKIQSINRGNKQELEV